MIKSDAAKTLPETFATEEYAATACGKLTKENAIEYDATMTSAESIVMFESAATAYDKQTKESAIKCDLTVDFAEFKALLQKRDKDIEIMSAIFDIPRKKMFDEAVSAPVDQVDSQPP